MKIENTSVLGLYKYDGSLQFERGDLVVNNKIIYVVDKDVCGVEPSTDTTHEYYSIYLAEDILQPSEFGQDEYAHKFVTAQVLEEVLSNYMYNTKTYIRNIFTGDVDKEGNVTTYNLDNSYSTTKDVTLDDFFDKFKSGIWQLNDGDCILRQSVYSIADPVQELFYPEKGILRYRTKSDKTWKDFQTTTQKSESTVNENYYYYEKDTVSSEGEEEKNSYITYGSTYKAGEIVNVLLMKTENGISSTKNIVTPLPLPETKFSFNECSIELTSAMKVKIIFTAGDWEPKDLSRRVYYNGES